MAMARTTGRAETEHVGRATPARAGVPGRRTVLAVGLATALASSGCVEVAPRASPALAETPACAAAPRDVVPALLVEALIDTSGSVKGVAWAAVVEDLVGLAWQLPPRSRVTVSHITGRAGRPESEVIGTGAVGLSQLPEGSRETCVSQQRLQLVC